MNKGEFMKEQVIAVAEKLIIPTYPEAPVEEMPMFAENRVHQRTSGNPYPNKVVLEVNREEKIDKEYTVVRLENEYISVLILPEIGGRIYAAKDKTTGYDFFYKQHVIKPALIGVLGSWVSGGVEFNWPFHHSPSGYMPYDFKIINHSDGSAECMLAEHDPIDRMKGTVSIILRPGKSYLETKMCLYNRTSVPHSFLWWENAAVPVNEDYRIFFPKDVTYVNFHYLKSRTTFPIAGNGVFNGIPMDTDRDISWHKNTKQATSYFASASDFDFFGGYDYGKECGVVHIGDHHVSPGKKMFTWAYCQLAKSWENALTDTDGQYAELMAGSYSDNQPDFSWLEPYETKRFSQYWYPISKIGTPTFANLNVAFNIEHSGANSKLKIQSTEVIENAKITVRDKDNYILQTITKLSPENIVEYEISVLPEYVTVDIESDNKIIATYTEQNFDKYKTPDPITDMPSAASMTSADELYLAGVHVDQYRDPAVRPDAYWKEALKRNPEHINSLIAMAEYEYNRYSYETATKYIDKAIEKLCMYNCRPQSGKVYYVKGLILEATKNYKEAYDFYNKSAWAADCVNKAMTKIAILDMRNSDYEKAVKHANTALLYSGDNTLAACVLIFAYKNLNNQVEANKLIQDYIKKDPMNNMLRYISDKDDFYENTNSGLSEICLDLTFELSLMGQYKVITELLEGLVSKRVDYATKMVLYTLAYFKEKLGENAIDIFDKAENANLGRSYPVRREEKNILEYMIDKYNSNSAKYLLGCLLYNKLHYEGATKLWNESDENSATLRNLAVAYFSHLNRADDALKLMKKALTLSPDDKQLLYETILLMNKSCVDPKDKIELLTSKELTRDDCITELAKSYNQADMPDNALEVLSSHNFVPCEGGEHAIADQYIFAYFTKGRKAYKKGNYKEALEFFKAGQTLPQNLGAGIWNHCKLIPLKYYEALCLVKLNFTESAEEIFSYIANVQIEYFSNMHLKELPYFQAKSLLHLNQPTKAQHLITRYMREWANIKDTVDNGFFGTTPFFISFVDAPEKLRRAQYLYLMSLCNDFCENKDIAKEMIDETVDLNNELLYALSFKNLGFLD